MRKGFRVATSEYRLSVVIAGLGSREAAESNMERFVEAFDKAFPGAGAVMAANYRLETLDATFSVDAKDAREACEIGGNMFCEAANATGIPPTEILEIQATLVASAGHDQMTGEMAFAH